MATSPYPPMVRFLPEVFCWADADVSEIAVRQTSANDFLIVIFDFGSKGPAFRARGQYSLLVKT